MTDRRPRLHGAVTWAIGIAATVLYLGREPLLDRLDWLASRIGRYPLDLLALFLYLAVLVALLWRARGFIVRQGNRLAAALDRLEASLVGWLPRRLRTPVVSLAAALAVAAAVLAVAPRIDALEAWEDWWTDRWFALMFPVVEEAEEGVVKGTAEVVLGRERIRDDIVIVSIDNETLYRYGWPMPRHLHATLLDAIAAGRPKSIVFDVFLVDESADHPEWDRQVGEAAARAGVVYFAYPIDLVTGDALRVSDESLRLGEAESFGLSHVEGRFPPFSDLVGGSVRPDFVIADVARGARGQGTTNVQPDIHDGVLRRATLALRVGDRLYPALALRVAMDALGVGFDDLRVIVGRRLEVGSGLRVPIDLDGFTRLRYLARYDELSSTTFPYIPYWQVIRKDFAFTLARNPIDPGLWLEATAATRLTVDGTPSRLEDLDPARLVANTSVEGQLTISDTGVTVTALDLGTPGGCAEPGGEGGAFYYPYKGSKNQLGFSDCLGQVQLSRIHPDTFRDKHVLVGSTATGAHDIRVTPIGKLPGVEYHATLLNNLLDGDFISPAPGWLDPVLVVAACLLVGTLVPRLRPAGALGVLATGGLGLLGGAYAAFGAGHHVRVVDPLLALGASHILVMLYAYRAEQRERLASEEHGRFVEQLFGRYTSEAIVSTLLASPEALRLGGERRRVTVLMNDLRGFTSMTAQLRPEAVVAILNNFLAVMTEVILKWGGTIDEFIGDAILAVFGAPIRKSDDEARALACALEMQLAMTEVNRWNLAQGFPRVEMGIGLATGELVVGNIGSERRAKYAMVGNAINLCARIESCTVGGQVLVSRETRLALGELVRVQDEVSVTLKGLREPITIYDVDGIAPPYDVQLPRREERLVSLSEPAALRVTRLAGKMAAGPPLPGVFVSLSEIGGEIRTEASLRTLDNLAIQLLDHRGRDIPGDIYAKVLGTELRPGISYVRFTSVPPELRAYLAELVTPQENVMAAAQDGAAQNRAAQDRAAQDRAAQDRAAQDPIRPPGREG